MKLKILKLIFTQILCKKIGAPPYSLDNQKKSAEMKEVHRFQNGLKIRIAIPILIRTRI